MNACGNRFPRWLLGTALLAFPSTAQAATAVWIGSAAPPQEMIARSVDPAPTLLSLASLLPTRPTLFGATATPCGTSSVSAEAWRQGLENLDAARLMVADKKGLDLRISQLHAAAPCIAEPLEPQDWARLAFEEGVIAFTNEDEGVARAAFRNVHASGAGYEWIREFTPATQAFYFEAGLALAREEPGWLRVVAPATAELRLDGRSIGTDQPLPPGRHLVQVGGLSMVLSSDPGQDVTLWVPGASGASHEALAGMLSEIPADRRPSWVVTADQQLLRLADGRLDPVPEPIVLPPSPPPPHAPLRRRAGTGRGGGGGLLTVVGAWQWTELQNQIGEGLSFETQTEREEALSRALLPAWMGAGLAAAGTVSLVVSIPLGSRRDAR